MHDFPHCSVYDLPVTHKKAAFIAEVAFEEDSAQIVNTIPTFKVQRHHFKELLFFAAQVLMGKIP